MIHSTRYANIGTGVVDPLQLDDPFRLDPGVAPWLNGCETASPQDADDKNQVSARHDGYSQGWTLPDYRSKRRGHYTGLFEATKLGCMPAAILDVPKRLGLKKRPVGVSVHRSFV
jgi:hypothetical protein